MDERYTYPEIIKEILGTYYVTCRRKITDANGWSSNEHEIGYAQYDYDGVFTTDIEEIMYQTVCLILDAGRLGEKFRDSGYEIINNILSRVSLDSLLADIPRTEADQFRSDLKILKLIQ